MVEYTERFSIDVKGENGLEIYFTDAVHEWKTAYECKYIFTGSYYELDIPTVSDLSKPFKHFVLCEGYDDENDRVKELLEANGFEIAGAGDVENGRRRIWFLIDHQRFGKQQSGYDVNNVLK